MTMPLSGRITLDDARVELGHGSAPISLGTPTVRTLGLKPTGQIALSDLYGKSAYVPSPFIIAIGGSVEDVNIGGIIYRVHTFTSSGDLIITETGATWNTLEYEVVGAGGGGGWTPWHTAGSGGGGGGGAFKTGAGNASVSTLPAIVGKGGTYNNNGGNSSFNSLVSLGGGGGGSYVDSAPKSGASGGGAGQDNGDFGAPPLDVNGHPGGGGLVAPAYNAGGGGGGGGQGGPGASSYGSPTQYHGGNGGPGVVSNFTPIARIYSAGGGGAGCNATTKGATPTPVGDPGIGGSGVGGTGARHNITSATVPAANSGSGGGGGNGQISLPSDGADGIVRVRYRVA